MKKITTKNAVIATYGPRQLAEDELELRRCVLAVPVLVDLNLTHRIGSAWEVRVRKV